MLVSQSRPRDLGWYHAGPLLFGDWGTSRLYVLGLAFASMHFASPIYLIGLSCLMAAVAWAYTIICRSFPHGGGVYTAARQLSPVLAVMSATLLLADYIVTVCISLVDAFHYLGLPEGPNGWWIYFACAGSMLILGVLNWFGARNAGRAALIVALAAMAVSMLIAVLAIPFVPEGLRQMKWDTGTPALTKWINFTGIVLALSGVEAVANMTGLMKEPVARTAKRTIWPVLCEVAILNIVFIVAICGLKALATAGKVPGFDYSDDLIKNAAMKVLAIEAGQYWLGTTAGYVLGKVSAVVFGLLLISAANTAILAMVSVIYALAQDKELPPSLTKLNYSGVPMIPLIAAVAMPMVVLLFARDVETLAHLYAIGVCGAITIAISCTVVTKGLPIATWERVGMAVIAAIVGAVWITIALTKYHALLFICGLVAAIMITRMFVHWRAARQAERMPEPEIGWLAEMRREPLKLDMTKPRIMLAARGRFQAEYAVDMAKKRGATLFVIYVRTLRVIDMRPDSMPRIEDDRLAQESLGTAALLARAAGVPLVPIYVCSPKIAEEILDYTATYGCDTLIMGKSQRRLFTRTLEGDVISEVARHLPDGVALITREATPYDPAAPARPGT